MVYTTPRGHPIESLDALFLCHCHRSSVLMNGDSGVETGSGMPLFGLSWKIKQKCQKMDPRPKSEFRPRFCLPNVVVWAPHPGESSGWLGPSDKDLRRALEKFPDLSVKSGNFPICQSS